MCNLKTVLFFFLLLGCNSTSPAQSIEAYPDALPQTFSSKNDWEKFLENHLVYPEKHFSQKKETQFIVKIIISEKGEVQEIVFPDQVEYEFQSECLRLIRLLEWVPGKKNDMNVISSVSLKFEFNIDRYKKAVKKRGFSKPKTDKKVLVDSSNLVIQYPDKIAEFYQGENQLNEYLSETLEYPVLARNQNIQGIVQLSFVIETNGMISNIKVDKPLGAGCSEAAVEVIRDTRWKPAVHKGKYVRSRMQYAINFSLNERYRSNEMGEQK